MNSTNKIDEYSEKILVEHLSETKKHFANQPEGEINTPLDSANISARSIRIVINSTLTLSGVSIPPQGGGYLTNSADIYPKIYQENGGYRHKIQIDDRDLTPAGPSGTYTSNKVLENLPLGKYQVDFDFESYWRHGGRFTYSCYATIEGDGQKKWDYQLVATEGQGQDGYKNDRPKVTVEVTG